MPRATIGLLAIVLWGCVPEGDYSSADSDLTARRGHHERHAPWNPPRKGHWFHGSSGEDDGHDDSTTVDDLLKCVDACNADEDDDGCHDDHHWWRHSGNRPDTQEECQALWDSLDDTERTAVLSSARDALDECGVEGGGSTCESFVAEDDYFVFQLGYDLEGNPLPPPAFVAFDVFEGSFGFADVALPEGSGMQVASDTAMVDAPGVDLAFDGLGTWSEPVQYEVKQFSYTACCMEPDGSSSGVCDTAMVTLQAC